MSFFGGKPTRGARVTIPAWNVRTPKKAAPFSVILGCLVVSACVGSGGPLNLSSTNAAPPLQLPEYSEIAETPLTTSATTPQIAEDVGEQKKVAGVVVPTAAPRTNETPTPVLALAETPPATPEVPAQSPVTIPPEKPATLENPTDEIAIAALPDQNAQQPGVTDTPVSLPERKNLLERLFGGSSRSTAKPSNNTNRIRTGRDDGGPLGNNRKPKKKPARTIVRETTRPPVVASGAALPGMRSSTELLSEQNGGGPVVAQPPTQLAAVGGLGRLSPNGLRVQHEKVKVDCLKPGVIKLLKVVERRYGSKPIITSGSRSPNRNRRAGGVAAENRAAGEPE